MGIDEKQQVNEIEEINRKLVSQEHRLFFIVHNLYKFKYVEPNKSYFNSSISALISFFISPSTAIIGGSLLISIISIFIAIKTLGLLNDQNGLIKSQNQLIEAQRKSSLVFLFNNIMDAIDFELKTSVQNQISAIKNPEIKRVLSKQLTGRIIALSRRLEPYKVYNYSNDSVESSLISPERGQLLVNLLESEIDSSSLFEIFQRGDFSYAQIKNYKKESVFLKGINLSFADLTQTDFTKVSLEDANLSNANLTLANIVGGNLLRTRLTNADLTDATIAGSKLFFCNMESSILDNTRFVTSSLQGASIINANLDSVSFRSSNIDGLKIFQFAKDTLITKEQFKKYLKSRKTRNLEELLNDYELRKFTLPKMTKDGTKLIRLGNPGKRRNRIILDSTVCVFNIRLKTKLNLRTDF